MPMGSIHLPFPEIRGSRFELPTLDPKPFATRLAEMRDSGSYDALGADSLVVSLVLNHGDFRLGATQRGLNGQPSAAGAAAPLVGFVAVPGYGLRSQAQAWSEGGRGPVMPPGRAFEQTGYLAGGPNASMVATRPVPDYAFNPWSARPTALVYGLLLSADRRNVTGGRSAYTSEAMAFAASRRDQPAAGTVFRGPASPDLTGDFDNGLSFFADGPYINAPDSGDARALVHGGTPYFDNVQKRWVDNPGHFSPYRQVPSPVMFGSLPTGVQANVPWQTLLFRPDAWAGTEGAHFGSRLVADHYLLDLFRMPVVQPSTAVNWADLSDLWMPSDVGSTAGRINLNHELVPFAHIRRTTALRALLKPQKILAIPDAAGLVYKTQPNQTTWRHYLDADQTLRQWDATFARGDVFRHPSEICTMWLVPEGAMLENMASFWAQHRLTGDNAKERPYANIYPHLTTRSTTFELHVLVQTLELAEGGAPDSFRPGIDRITGERRSQWLLRSHLDGRAPGMPDYVKLLAEDPAADFTPADAFADWLVYRAGVLEEADAPASNLAAGGVTADAVSGQWSLEAVPSSPGQHVTLRYSAPLGHIAVLESSRDLKIWQFQRLVSGAGADVPQSVDAGLPPAPDQPEHVYFRLRSVGLQP